MKLLTAVDFMLLFCMVSFYLFEFFLIKNYLEILCALLLNDFRSISREHCKNLFLDEDKCVMTKIPISTIPSAHFNLSEITGFERNDTNLFITDCGLQKIFKVDLLSYECTQFGYVVCQIFHLKLWLKTSRFQYTMAYIISCF